MNKMKKTEMEIENEFKFLNARIMFTWFLEYFLSMCASMVFFHFFFFSDLKSWFIKAIAQKNGDHMRESQYLYLWISNSVQIRTVFSTNHLSSCMSRKKKKETQAETRAQYIFELCANGKANLKPKFNKTEAEYVFFSSFLIELPWLRAQNEVNWLRCENFFHDGLFAFSIGSSVFSRACPLLRSPALSLFFSFSCYKFCIAAHWQSANWTNLSLFILFISCIWKLIYCRHFGNVLSSHVFLHTTRTRVCWNVGTHLIYVNIVCTHKWNAILLFYMQISSNFLRILCVCVRFWVLFNRKNSCTNGYYSISHLKLHTLKWSGGT